MKKIFALALSVVLLVGAIVGLVGCGETENEKAPTNPEDCEIGYQVDAYPNFPFDYELQKDGKTYTFHIESIKVTLIGKNEIPSDTPFTGTFEPYIFEIAIKASTSSAELKNKNVIIRYNINDSKTTIHSTVKEDGTIEWKTTRTHVKIPVISFSDILMN